MSEFEYRYGPLEFREGADGMGTVTGAPIKYGDLATLPFGQERVLPGAFGDLSVAELYINRMHQRDQPLANTYAGLRVDDNAERLYGEADLPNTSYGRDAQEEVKTGRLRGLSIEFRTLEDDFIDGIRVIKSARLYGWAVVDKPAYPQSVAAMRSWTEYRSAHGLSVIEQPKGLAEKSGQLEPEAIRYTDFPLDLEYENRQVENMRLRGRLPYGVDGITSMARGERVRFLPGAFADSLGGEIVLLAGNNYDDVLAANGDSGQLAAPGKGFDGLEFEARRLATHPVR